MAEYTDGLASALSLAPSGARCAAEGFTDFKATPYGWQQAETGWLVSSGLLAEMITERHAKPGTSEHMLGSALIAKQKMAATNPKPPVLPTTGENR